MKTPKSSLVILFASALGLCFPLFASGQDCLRLSEQADIASTCSAIAMTMEHDQMGRPFLYVANKEAGLRIYDISDIQSPALVKEIGTEMLEGLEVMNLSQDGNFLYLALGNFFSGDQPPGLAIVEVSAPASALVRDVWAYSVPTQGAGIVEVTGQYAYLGAMGHGLITLDISNKGAIEFVSLFTPDITFPSPNPDPPKYNARGLVVNDGLVYLCYDAGGIRIIDVSTPQQPEEIGRYSNPALNALPRAYNNALLHGGLLCVSFDYCGLEILDVSNPENIFPVSWWNPWNCQSNPLNWFSSPGHTNELAYDESCGLLFLSSGKSDLQIVDISNPAQPDRCGSFGSLDDGIGSWGVASYGDKVFLSYVCSFIPFASTRTGVKLLAYDGPCITGAGHAENIGLSVFPNPAASTLSVNWEEAGFAEGSLKMQLFDAQGQRIARYQASASDGSCRLDVKLWPSGVYWLVIHIGNAVYTQKVIVGLK
ncbi:MAG: T9SS type A sorting domain-containing protein [Phaeodactylibacter sp.]|nr:T9SS type A sorting domain-containing protein [Phaeodactylibacter sp.]